ncbi:MAG: MetQ/NlpA family ABC transporter substrate-binding protein [Syntrophomonas sp.]
MKMKRFLVFCLMLAISFNLMACGKAKDGKEAAPTQKTITIGIMPDVESIPMIIADKQGFFQKQGVNVKIMPFKSAKDRDSALQAGQLDGMITDLVAVVFANEGGINLRVISKTDGNIQMLGGKDTGISSLADLKGKSVGLSSNTIMEYTVDRMIATAGLNPEDIQKVAIPQLPNRLEMLNGGKIQACILPDPLAGLAVKGGARVLYSTDQTGTLVGAIAFTEKCLKENPDQIKAVFRAYNDAVAYLQNEPPASYIDYVIQQQGFAAETRDILKLPAYKAEPSTEAAFNDVVQWMKAKNLIKGSYDYNTLVDKTILGSVK